MSDPFYFLIYWAICIAVATVCEPGCDVIDFEIHRIYLIKLFLYMTKEPREKPRYLENEKSVEGEIKSIFIIFKGLSVAKNCLRPESALLIFLKLKPY